MNEWTITHKVEVESPGFFFSEQSTFTISERTIEAAIAVLPNDGFRFRFYDALACEVDVEGQVETVRKTANHSPWHYYGGSIYTLDEVKELCSVTGEHKILIANMEGNGWDRVIQTPFGNWHPWESDFVYVPLARAGGSRD